MTSYPQDSRPGGATPRPGPGPGAAGSPPVRVTAANPGAAAVRTDGGTRGTPQGRAGGAGHPVSPPALPAPGHPGAEGGLHEPSPQAPARAPVAVPARGGRGNNPSPQGREGTAGPGAPVPGPAQASTPAPKGAAGVAREEEASVRTLRASLPPAKEPAGGTRPGTQPNTSPPAVPLSGGEPREWKITLPAGLELLSMNGREHYQVRHRKAQALKDAAIVMTRKAKVPQLRRITFTVVYDPPDGRYRDADNLAPTGKALLDGAALVILPLYGGKKRVVPGDDSRHVARVSLEIGPEPFPRGRLRMVITEVPGGSEAA